MPPRIRTRASRALKENIDAAGNKVKGIKNDSKAPRKALADKTNSASDDASLEIPKKSKKTSIKPTKLNQKEVVETKKNVITTVKHSERSGNTDPKEDAISTNDVRPRRNRQIPKRFVENQVLNNMSNSKGSPNITVNSSKIVLKADNTPKYNDKSISDIQEPSPFKTPAKSDSSLLANRPKRICRLPSRFEDHSISPVQYIPIKPTNASTPIQQSKTKSSTLIQPENSNTSIEQSKTKAPSGKETENIKVGKVLGNVQVPKSKQRLLKIALQKASNDNVSDKSSPDSNNNARGRSTRMKTTKTRPQVSEKLSTTNKNTSPIRKFLTPINKTQLFCNKKKSPLKKVQSPKLINTTRLPTKKISPQQSNNKRLLDKNLSFKVLESKKKSQDIDKHDLDVYEFTFNPDEEPQPQKKKRKRVVTKKIPKPDKPKKVIHKSSYDQNISKALAALKKVVNPGKLESLKLAQITENSELEADTVHKNLESNVNEVQNMQNTKETNNDTGKNSEYGCNYPSIRVEDIAADIEPSMDHMDHYDDINYSPVNSPRPNVTKSPDTSVKPTETLKRHVDNNDPLNLQEDLSFFDDQPVASSSMNMSTRHPLASPWRVEFGSLPIKWPNNTYVKPNMTPAVESSFISSEDTIQKKHVYTNMLPQTNEMFTDIDNTPNLKQTSIISFIKEMAEKSVKKKQRKSLSPTKAVYEEVVDTNKNKKMNKKTAGNKNSNTNTSEEVSSGNDTTHNKENSKEEQKTRKRKNDDNICDIPAKSPRKPNDKDCTYFGFDESVDTENLSPVKCKKKGRSLRPRSRAVLQEINGPTRAVLPLAAKTKIATSSEAINKVYEELKSAADAPIFPDKHVDDCHQATNINDATFNDDSQSVHLFEDIEVVHHLKPTRKSYGKAKKVTFRQHSTSDSDSHEPIGAVQNDSSDDFYDDLGDLTFEIPNVKVKKTTKKKKPKKLRTKKEEQEAEAWAADFNSMCEDIEEFPLLVE